MLNKNLKNINFFFKSFLFLASVYILLYKTIKLVNWNIKILLPYYIIVLICTHVIILMVQ